MEQNASAILQQLAERFEIELVYAFGSRAHEVLDWSRGQVDAPLPLGSSDVDIGIKTRSSLSVEQKVRITISLEDALGVARVDLVCLEEADAFLAANIIRGELLFTTDLHLSDEYELFVLRRADDLLPLERERIQHILRSDG